MSDIIYQKHPMKYVMKNAIITRRNILYTYMNMYTATILSSR